MELFLYTRMQCHLCDELRSELDKQGLSYHLIDIDSDPELVHRYGARIPVLVADDTEVCEGMFDRQCLTALKTSA